ncbi:MAG: FAD:protein FMN transferase [Bacteroidia bacterium]|nr:FAD:protein FMN transferase [Bacteroidia bacterium]
MTLLQVKPFNFLFTAVFVLSLGCEQPKTLKKIQFTGEAQGTYYAVTYYSSDNKNYQTSVDSLLKEFDQTASLWEERSMINKVNNDEDVVVNDAFLELFRISQEVSEVTD